MANCANSPTMTDKENAGRSEHDFASPPHSSLLDTSKHNQQSAKLIENSLKKKKTAKKSGGAFAHRELMDLTVGSGGSGLPINLVPPAQEAGGDPHELEITLTSLYRDLTPAEKIKYLEEELTARAKEISQLKHHLHDANMQMAEVVAQSAIVVRDVQCAAIKEIANAKNNVDFLVRKLEAKEKDCTCLEKQCRPFTRLDTGVAPSRSNGIDTATGKASFRQHEDTTEGDSITIRQELLDCKLRFFEVKNQLQVIIEDKQRLELQFRSSVQTALKLQDAITNHKMVTKLEQLAMEEHIRNEAAHLIHSSTMECKQMQKELHEALMSKGEVECLLRNCMKSLCEAESDLKELRKLADEDKWRYDLLHKEKSAKLLVAEEQAELLRQMLDELQMESVINCIVLECLWEGAVNTMVVEANIRICADAYAEEAHLVGIPAFNSCTKLETGFNGTKEYAKKRMNAFPCSPNMHLQSKESVTPMQHDWNVPTPRFIRSTWKRSNSNRELYSKTSPERVSYLQREAALKENLTKSEFEVEILGDKVDEQRAVLEKVSLLLEYVCTSGITAQGTKYLMRSIIHQLQQFEIDCSKS